jgi:hypothetical protein
MDRAIGPPKESKVARIELPPQETCMFRLLILTVLLSLGGPLRAFDPEHQAWTDLLAQHVQWNAAGTATSVDYDGLLADHARLKSYLAELSAVPSAQVAGWSKSERRAFLLNAYNAFTIELILRAWPKVGSIKDLGSLFSSPWKQRFFTLFGKQQHLDGIEHDLIRGAADYDDPRIHFAVNCASIGCPALRPEAYRGADLEAQLDDQTRRFLRDRTRNRFDAADGTLYLSRIFDWYGEDFERGLLGSQSVTAFVAGYPAELGIDAASAAKLTTGEFDIEFLDYDWALNRSAR